VGNLLRGDPVHDRKFSELCSNESGQFKTFKLKKKTFQGSYRGEPWRSTADNRHVEGELEGGTFKPKDR